MFGRWRKALLVGGSLAFGVVLPLGIAMILVLYEPGPGDGHMVGPGLLVFFTIFPGAPIVLYGLRAFVRLDASGPIPRGWPLFLWGVLPVLGMFLVVAPMIWAIRQQDILSTQSVVLRPLLLPLGLLFAGSFLGTFMASSWLLPWGAIQVRQDVVGRDLQPPRPDASA